MKNIILQDAIAETGFNARPSRDDLLFAEDGRLERGE